MTQVEQQEIDRLLEVNLESVDPRSLPALRGQHPKTHGLVAARFRVRDDVPPELRHGVFSRPAQYDALVRFSNGRVWDDRKSDAHGMAIKLLDVPGRKILPGREEESAQDFILIDSETFFTGDPKEYTLVNRVLMAGGFWEKARAWPQLLLRPHLLLRLRSFASKTPRSPLASGYFSSVPYKLGDRFVKYVVRPRSEGPLPALDNPNGLAWALVNSLAQAPAGFEFGVDLQVDPGSQPIEDPTRAWSSAPGARRVWIAELELPVQTVQPAAPLAENICFSPWHSLPEHEPVGFINRAREPIYRAMQKERHELNAILPEESSGAPASYGDPPHPAAGAPRP